MKITLIGFMGSGKTTVGKLLSKSLKITFIDLDDLIVQRTAMEIPQIFKEFGEEGFRKIEREILEEILNQKGEFVLSTGGGAPAYSDNLELINKNSTSVFLKADFETLWNRISMDKNRPLVSRGKEELLKLYRERLPFYEKAHIVVDTTNKSPEEVVEEIEKALSKVSPYFQEVNPTDKGKESGHCKEEKVKVEGNG